jgi:cysteine-rich repeat protein
LWVFYEDEVICSGTEALEIVEDGSLLAPNKVNIVLECNLSVNGPSGDLNVDGSFEFINGNYCPKLNWLGAVPTVLPAALPLETTIEVSAFDPDSTCGLNCDPQTCDLTQNPPLCTASPDPGFKTRLFAPAGHGSLDPDVAMGMTPMQGGTPIDAQATYTCNPLFPGPTEICVIASDGDNDCDQMRCITVICPDLCAAVDCDDGNECTRDRCDPLSGLCSNDPAPDGIACDACNGTCQSSVCDAGSPFVADFVFSGAIAIDGLLQSLNTTFVNPYSGASVSASGVFYVNQSSYLGSSAFDTLGGTGLQDILLARTPAGDQTLCGVERVFSLNSFDVLGLADEFIVLGDTEIQGGNEGDVLWANAGNDLLRGNNGPDLLDGGPGNDTIFGETGDDTIALWPGSGFDSIDGGNGIDQVVVDAEQSQITITPAANGSYEFDIAYLGTPMAQIIRAELIEMNDALIDLSLCTGSAGDVCNLCGNDALNGGEECDDGNNLDGDGCAADCTGEY